MKPAPRFSQYPSFRGLLRVSNPALQVRRAWWAIGWLGVGLAVYLSLMRDPPSLHVPQGDKLEHIAAYGMLMVWFAQAPDDRVRLRVVAFALIGLGIALEFAQLATGYREFSGGDMLADAIGVAIGWLLAPPRLPNLLACVQRTMARWAASS
jgi:VanZ family protein